MQTLNAKEAAAFLKIDIDTLYRRAAAGKLPGIKEGRGWVFIADDLAQYLRARYVCKTDSKGNRWGSTDETAPPSGGTSSRSRNAAYRKALEPATVKPRKQRSR